jgi:hypothetical protein
MIDLTYMKLQHLMNMLRSFEELQALKPKGPLTPQRIKYPINLAPECEPHSPGKASQTMGAYNQAMKSIYGTKKY